MIYLDSAASSPILKEVIEEMKPFIEGGFSNASSNHKCADIVKSAIDLSRERVSNLINSNTEEVIFTSGATEAIITVLPITLIPLSERLIPKPMNTRFCSEPSIGIIACYI